MDPADSAQQRNGSKRTAVLEYEQYVELGFNVGRRLLSPQWQPVYNGDRLGTAKHSCRDCAADGRLRPKS